MCHMLIVQERQKCSIAANSVCDLYVLRVRGSFPRNAYVYCVYAGALGERPVLCEVRSDDTLNSDKFYCRHCTCSATSALLCRLRCAVVSASRPKCSIVSSVDEVCSQAAV